MSSSLVPVCTAILVLGGEPERDVFAVRLSRELLPPLHVFVSSPGGGAPERLKPLAETGLLHLSWTAVDTVTNFSTMIPALLEFGIAHVWLVTSDYHMPRAEAVARIMFGGSHISFEPRPVAAEHDAEPWHKMYRDVLRAWLWRFTGWDLRWLARRLTAPALRGTATVSDGTLAIGMGHEV